MRRLGMRLVLGATSMVYQDCAPVLRCADRVPRPTVMRQVEHGKYLFECVYPFPPLWGKGGERRHGVGDTCVCSGLPQGRRRRRRGLCGVNPGHVCWGFCFVKPGGGEVARLWVVALMPLQAFALSLGWRCTTNPGVCV